MTDPRDNEPSSMDETGSTAEDLRLVTSSFGPYTITLRLTTTNQFVDIVSVHIARDFRSTTERNKGIGFHDVSDLYEGKEK